MAGILVGKDKLAAEVTQTEAFPPQGIFEFTHSESGPQPADNTDTGDHKSIMTGISQTWFLLSLFTLCTFTNASTLLAVFAGFSTSPITTLHAAIPNQFHSSALDFLLSDLFFSE